MADAPDTKNDITAADGKKITTEAASWIDTPYAMMGANSIKGKNGKGDCSGTTSNIFKNAGFPYPHQATATFATYVTEHHLFRKLGPGEPKQDGDVLLWSDHMAIYSTFTSTTEVQYKTTERTNKAGKPWTQHNDMWTASHTGGKPYRPSAIEYSGKKSAPEVYRYIGGKK